MAAGLPVPHNLRAVRLAAQRTEREAARQQQAEAQAAAVAEREAAERAAEAQAAKAKLEARLARQAKAHAPKAPPAAPAYTGPRLSPDELLALRKEVLAGVLAARGICDLSGLDEALSDEAT